MIFATTDLNTVLDSLFKLLIAAIGAWILHKQNKVEKKVDVIHQLTNSGAGIQARTLEVSAKALAAAKDTPENQQLALNATKAVKEHDIAQAKADALK